MYGLDSVAKNWGDFDSTGQWHARFGGMQEGDRQVPTPQDLLGTNAYADHEPGYRRNNNYAARVTEAYGRRFYEKRMAWAANVIERGFNGSRRDRLRFEEAMSISDFPNLFGDVIDRAVLANYLEVPYTWNMIANMSEVNDFRPVKRFRIDGGTGIANQDANGNLIPVNWGAQYPETYVQDNFIGSPGYYTYQLQKYGMRMPFFWETFVNDDLNALKDTPARFGRGQRRNEEYFVTKLFAGNLTFFSNANANLVNAANAGGPFTANDPALTLAGLQQAMVVLMNQKDSTGQPISIEAMTLVVPPALKTIAMNILNTDYVMMADQGGTTNVYGSNSAAMFGQALHAANWARNIVRLAVNYYLPIIDTTQGGTGWYLFSNPENGRPAIEMGKLRGHLTPELFMKLPNSVAIGEGTMGPGPGIIPGTTNMDPMEGDFDTDSVHYKIRNVFGGTTLDPIMAVFSKGTNA